MSSTTGPDQYKDIAHYRKRIKDPKKWKIKEQEMQNKNKIDNIIQQATHNAFSGNTQN